MKLNALNTAGGKSAYSVPQGPWIASMLPQDLNVCYAEPFGRFAGVMLQRQPSKNEILNDTDHFVIGWWQQIKDNLNALIHQLELTPCSRVRYEEACDKLLSGDQIEPLEQARLFTIAIDQGITHTIERRGWSIRYKPLTATAADRPPGYWERKLTALAARMKLVKLECRPAAELLARLSDIEEAVIYCDPPYPTATDFYGNAALDVPELSEVLLQQTGRVAISGYDDEWSHLGWEEHKCPVISKRHKVADQNSGKNARREKLWTNYTATQQSKLL